MNGSIPLAVKISGAMLTFLIITHMLDISSFFSQNGSGKKEAWKRWQEKNSALANCFCITFLRSDLNTLYVN